MTQLYSCRRNFVMLAASAAGAGLLGCEQTPQKSGASIIGAGATFPLPLYERWILEYGRETGTYVGYKGSGSSDGIQAITTDRTDFAGTDVPMTDDELSQAGDVIHVPMTLGGVAIAYNAPGVPKELKFDGEVLADVFLGEISQWNDAKIAALNPGESLPDLPIKLVVRADGSGTTLAFTDFLSSTSAKWRERVGTGKKVQWPSGFAAQHNDGVADTVRRKRGTIGYVQASFASSRRLDVAAIKNRAGEFRLPTVEAVSAAAENTVARIQRDLRASTVNADGSDSYPIAAYSYVLVRRDTEDLARARSCAEFLWWGLTEGQKYGPVLGYAELPEPVVKLGQASLRGLRFKGQPVLAGF